MALLREHINEKAVFRAITDDATFATVLQVICLICYGEEIYDLDIIELRLRLNEDFGAELTEHNENKLNAIMLATSTDIFYEQPDAFRGICNTLLDGDPGLDVFDDLTIIEMLWAIYEVELNHSPHEFSTPVSRMMNRIMEGEAYEDEALEPGQDEPITAGLKETRERLLKQLNELGVEHPDLPEISPVGG